MEHEALPRLALKRLDLLRVVVRAERAGDERLRFAAGEDGRSMCAREDAGLDPDRPDFVELAAVEAHAAREYFFAEDLLLQLLENRFRVGAPLRLGLGDGRHELFERRLDAFVVLELVVDPHGLREGFEYLALDLAVEV